MVATRNYNFPHIAALLSILLGEAWWILVGSLDYNWRYCGFNFSSWNCAGVSTSWIVYGGFSTFELIFWIFSWINADNFLSFKRTMALIGTVVPLVIYAIPVILWILSFIYDFDPTNTTTKPNFIWMFAVGIGMWFITIVSHLFLLDDTYTILFWRQQMMMAIGVTPSGRNTAISSNVNNNVVSPT